mmetsp:Transcript_5494/g.15985  ORF Transcript_5494/g.15985 Transcript_5494/m.15985 type:complete len:441 (+) Transcript_5494:23-1345(+)
MLPIRKRTDLAGPYLSTVSICISHKPPFEDSHYQLLTCSLNHPTPNRPRLRLAILGCQGLCRRLYACPLGCLGPCNLLLLSGRQHLGWSLRGRNVLGRSLVWRDLRADFIDVPLHEKQDGFLPPVARSDLHFLQHADDLVDLGLGEGTLLVPLPFAPRPDRVGTDILNGLVEGFARVVLLPGLVVDHGAPDAGRRLFRDRCDNRIFGEESDHFLRHSRPRNLAGQILVRDHEALVGSESVHVIRYVLLPLLQLHRKRVVPPTDPFVHRRPQAVILQLVLEFVQKVMKGRDGLDGIPDHHERPLDFVLPVQLSAMSVWEMSFDRHNLLPPSIRIPIVSGDDACEGLDEIPRHARPGPRVGGGKDGLDPRRGGDGGRDEAPTVGEGLGHPAAKLTVANRGGDDAGEVAASENDDGASKTGDAHEGRGSPANERSATGAARPL